MELEYRMYGLVPYNISPIQQAIQYGHALQEYNNKYFARCDEFTQWRTKDKTFIILNGGTTNRKPDIVTGEIKGSLNKHQLSLSMNDIETASFYEPDLNDALTAVVFLVDERVFNNKEYPDWESARDLVDPTTMQPVYWDESEWEEAIGGPKNVFLREFLSQFKLA